MVTEIKLLPCPFCGGEVKIDMLDSENSRNVKIYSAVHCPKCHEWFFKGLSKEKTVAAWNRRVDARQLALKTRVCPMCEDCPDGCPVETPEDSRNVVTNIVGVDSAELQLNLEFDELNKVTDALNRLAAYEDTGLTPEEVHQLKAKYEALESDKNVIESSHINAEMNLEAQQQEIDRLKELLADWKYNAKCDADHIAALTADKDEQAETIMRLANGLKKLRSSLQWLKETIHDLGYKAWAEDNIGKIDALLGGKEERKEL
jgi:hypothetical protein